MDVSSAVSRHEVSQALAERGITVRSLDGLVWHLEIINRIWRSGFGQNGKNGRRARLYTTRFKLTRPSNHLDMSKVVPPEVRRAVRDVAAALRGAAEALSRLDELADGDASRPRERFGGVTQGGVVGVTESDVVGVTEGDVVGVTESDVLGVTEGDVLGDADWRAD